MKKVSFATKFLYGIGLSARGIKDGLFQIFLFFYFSQVLGLDPKLAGTASIIALLFDAVSDPLVGVISDNWKSEKWGRRHPFMFASAIPLGILTYLLFAPPHGLEQTGLFWWLLSLTVLLRLALTVFLVPYISLGAELSTDYNERTSITATRIMFAAFISPVIMIIGFTMFFKKTDDISHGLFNLEAYPQFALLCGILMVFFVFLSAWGTRHVIPGLPQPSEEQRNQSFWSTIGGLKIAFQMPSFLSLVLYTMMLYVGIGIGVVFSTYFGTYFFEFTETEMAALPVGSAIGGLISLGIAPLIGRWLDKKWGALWSSVIFGIFFTLPFNLRLLGLFPENGTPYLLPLYVVTLIVAYCFLWVSMSLATSMMAEVVDEFELKTNNRQEGLFFAFMSFAFKCTNGLGAFIAGLLLAWIAFPTQTDLADVPAEAIRGLGVVGGQVLMAFYLVSVVFIFFYPITKEKYEEIRKNLELAKRVD